MERIQKFGGVKINSQKNTATLTLRIRISNAQTGEIIATSEADGEASTTSTGIDFHRKDFDWNSSEVKSSAPGKAIDQAMKKAVKIISAGLAGEIWTAKVLNQDPATKRIILDAGSKNGLQKDAELVVYHRSASVINPETGESFPGDEVEVGRICIARLEGRVAYAKIIKGAGFKPGDIVRLPDTEISAR